MSSMRELTFFLGLQVKQKKDDIFISQDKYVGEILKKFGFTEVKTASTPMETQKPLLKDEDGEEVDVHMYRSMIGSLMYLTSSRPDIMFAYLVKVNAAEAKLTTAFEKQFWSTVKSKTVNGEVYLHALVDGKKIIITESIVRRDLQLEDVEGVDYEAVNEEMDDSLVRAATTSSSLEAEQDSDVVKTAEETRSVVEEVTTIIEKAKLGSVAEETVNAVATTVSTASTIPVSAAITTITATIIDVEITLAQALTELKSAKPKAVKVVIQEPEQVKPMKRLEQMRLDKELAFKLPSEEEEEEERLAREKAQQTEEANIAWDDVQSKIEADYQLAQRLQAQEQEELTDEEKERLFVQFLEQRRKYFTANRAEEKRNRPPTRAQQRSIITELVEESSKKAKTELEENSKKSEAEISQENSSKRAGEELEQESSKKQKVEEDKESEELKKCLEIVPDDGDDVTIDATPLSIKSPTIVDYKIYQEGKKSYF
ncbi:retrovirus-related pol polyprotein from transposon TNT 1-94 [Tanacetum coccineum]